MKHQDTSTWPDWAGRFTAANVFIAMLAARDLSALQAWRIAFWPSMGISALTAFAVGFVVTMACRKLERARLTRHAKVQEYRTRPEERAYITKAAADLNKVMQRPFAPRDRNGEGREKPFIEEIKRTRAEKRNAATDNDD